MKIENYKRTGKQRKEDLLLTIELKEKGYSLRDIAAHISSIRTYSVSHMQIHKSYTSAVKLDSRDIEENEAIQAHRQKGIELMEFIRDEALDSWNKSKGITKETIKKGTLNKTGEGGSQLEKQEITEKIIDSAGNPAYLNVVIKAEERKAKFLGTDSAIKVEDSRGVTIPENVIIKVDIREFSLPTSESEIEDIEHEDIND